PWRRRGGVRRLDEDEARLLSGQAHLHVPRRKLGGQLERSLREDVEKAQSCGGAKRPAQTGGCGLRLLVADRGQRSEFGLECIDEAFQLHGDIIMTSLRRLSIVIPTRRPASGNRAGTAP